MKTKLARTGVTLLTMSGALLILVGTSIFLSPDEFYASNNIELNNNTSLVNELKASAGLLLAAGLFMIYAIFKSNKRGQALCLAALIYISYAVSRSVSMAFDGLPAEGLVLATALEAIVGLACLIVWWVSRTPKSMLA